MGQAGQATAGLNHPLTFHAYHVSDTPKGIGPFESGGTALEAEGVSVRCRGAIRQGGNVGVCGGGWEAEP